MLLVNEIFYFSEKIRIIQIYREVRFINPNLHSLLATVTTWNIHRDTKRMSGSEQKVEFMICLVPELCQLTGLTDDQRSNFRLMKDVATYTRITPNQRHAAFKKVTNNFLNNFLSIFSFYYMERNRTRRMLFHVSRCILISIKHRSDELYSLTFHDHVVTLAGCFRRLGFVIRNVRDLWSWCYTNGL